MAQQITVNPTGATAQMTAAATETHDVIDAAGRILTLRKPPFLAQFDMVRALGNDASNEVYRTMVMPILYLSAIDGALVAMPANNEHIKAIVQRLGEGGYKAMMEGIAENWPAEPPVDGEALKN